MIVPSNAMIGLGESRTQKADPLAADKGKQDDRPIANRDARSPILYQ
jgi:hypothetical protein